MEDPDIVPMDISPNIACFACGDNKWGMCIVNTRTQIDWAWNKKLAYWYGRSECLNCGIAIRWEIDPDKNYPPTGDTNDASPTP
jgi:hypothetical protein